MTAQPPLPPQAPELPEQMVPYRTELETFFRELPRLLDAGDEGRIVVVRGGELHGTWDTARDALYFAHDKFPDGRFLSQKIDRRFLDALAPYFPAHAGRAVAGAV